MPNDCSSGQGARSVFLPYPALHEEGPTISGSSDEDEDTKCDVGTDATVESGEGEKGWQLSSFGSVIIYYCNYSDHCEWH